MESIFDQQVGANAAATSNINQAAANRLAAPSAGSLALGIGSAAVSGLGTGLSMKAPQGFNTPKPDASKFDVSKIEIPKWYAPIK